MNVRNSIILICILLPLILDMVDRLMGAVNRLIAETETKGCKWRSEIIFQKYDFSL